MAELSGVLIGNYFVLECLAHEGMVETYRARPTTRGGYDVVLRLFRPQFPDPTGFREHFPTEVEKVWRCRHPRIQPLLEFGTGDDLLFCATQLTEAETLEAYLKRQSERYLPVPLVLRFVTQLCEALQYAHEQGIVHGNIQPSSILVSSDENILLTHFAMKHPYQDGEPLVSQFNEGNPAYLAPEQSLGMVTPASDIYALGVLLYSLLGGELPYDGESPEEIALKHTDEPIPSLRELRPELPETLELVVRVALAKSPEARFPGPSALAQALLAAVVEDHPQIIPAVPERRIAVRSRRTPVTWQRVASFLTLSVLLIGLIGASFFIFSLPPHLPALQSLPFWRAGRSTTATAGTGSSSSGSTPTVTASSRGQTSPPSANGSHKPLRATPTGGASLLPVAGNTPGTASTPFPFACAQGALAIDGSQNLEPLLQQVDSDYQEQCPGMTVNLGGDGSRASLNLLQQGKIDVADTDLSARPERNLADHPVLALLYAVIVNPDVQVSSLSTAQIRAIYQGQITNWEQVGGPDQAITVIQRQPNDPVAAIFRAFMLNGQAEHVKGVRLKNDWVQAVAEIPGAIGYAPLLVAQEADVSIIAIDGVAPSATALQQGNYQFWSVEHLYTQGSGSPEFHSYLSFLTTGQESSLFLQYGAVPISTIPQDVIASHLPGPEI